MSTRTRKESTESRGGTTWNDGVYSFDGGSNGGVPGILSKTESTGVEPGTATGGDDGGVIKATWFAPVDPVDTVKDCPGGVCPVPWATVPERPVLQEDTVNHPSHYKDQGSIECIEAIESQLTPEEYQGYLRGNCAKYIWRWKNKGGVEDLKKARWYLDRLIATEES